MDFRVVISDPKNGKAYQVELKDAGANRFLGHHIGDKIDGGVLGLPGYSVVVTGGSDREGFPNAKRSSRRQTPKAVGSEWYWLSCHSRGQKEAQEHPRKRYFC